MWTEQLSCQTTPTVKTANRRQASQCWVGGYTEAKGRGQKDLWGDGLQPEMSASVHAQLYIQVVIQRNTYGCTRTHSFRIHAYFPCSAGWEPGSNDTPVTVSTHQTPRSWFLTPFSSEKKQGFLAKRMILGQRKKIFRMHWELQKVRVLKINIYNGGRSKGHGDQLKELPVTKAETVWATKQSWIKILSMK